MSDEQGGVLPGTSSTGMMPTPRPSVQVLPGQQILAQQAAERERDQQIVERLMDVASRRSESLGQIAAALARAQGEMTNALRDSTNPHFKSRFASLAAVRDACGPHLSKQEIAYLQTVRAFGRVVMVTTSFIHSSGEFIEETLSLVAGDDKPQTVGSAITYGRRYGLAAMAGIAPADDDGEEASRSLPKEIRQDKANTPLQQAVARQADEVREGPKGAEGGGIGGQVPTGGTPPPPAAGAAPRSRPSMGTSTTPPPPGRPPMRAPGSAPLQAPSGSSDK